jgi:D-beta-D-heptose 7-phosphate kinase/D-beta-D-heptose 1-phosphate adenosyltransferase
MTGRPPARLRALVTRFRRVRVLVLGDLMLDRFVWGDVRRISPEAPVPVVRVTAEEARAGGAGNVAANVAALGGHPAVAGLVGIDAAGNQLLAALRLAGADTTAVLRVRQPGTIEKTRIIAHHQQVVRLDRESHGAVTPALQRRLATAVLGRLRRADVLVVSDYGKGAIGAELLERLADRHARRAFTWVVDPKGVNFPHYRRASLVKPNLDEAALASGIEITGPETLRRAGQRLLERWESEAVLISRGEDGMTLFRRGGTMRTFPTAAREVFDVTGAGDTVVAACALALGAGGSFEDATQLANHAAGIVVGKVGTASVTARELLAALTDH